MSNEYSSKDFLGKHSCSSPNINNSPRNENLRSNRSNTLKLSMSLKLLSLKANAAEAINVLHLKLQQITEFFQYQKLLIGMTNIIKSYEIPRFYSEGNNDQEPNLIFFLLKILDHSNVSFSTFILVNIYFDKLMHKHNFFLNKITILK